MAHCDVLGEDRGQYVHQGARLLRLGQLKPAPFDVPDSCPPQRGRLLEPVHRDLNVHEIVSQRALLAHSLHSHLKSYGLEESVQVLQYVAEPQERAVTLMAGVVGSNTH